MLHEIDISRVRLNLLVLFETVLEERHVARAAKRLNLSATAVSHGLGRLREIFNDPLFLKHPKGVVPTARALALAPEIAQVLIQVRRIVASAEVFDPAQSQRRLVIGASDALALVTLPRVLEEIERAAPGICIGVQNLKPTEVLSALDAHQVDVALYPLDELHPRFEARELFKDEFAVAARAGHKLTKRMTLEGYCNARHVLVSTTADPHGIVDDVLKQQTGLTRKVVLTVPTFMLALAVVATSDMVGTMPRSIIDLHASSMNLVTLSPPVGLRKLTIRAVTPRVAMQDQAVAWLMDMLQQYGNGGLPEQN